MKRFLLANISLILVLLTTLSGCISTKRVEDGDYLLEKNTVLINEKRIFSSEPDRYIRQKPNQVFLGFYPFYLHLYNLADLNPEEEINRIKEENSGKVKFMEAVFSKKAVKGLELDYTSIQKWVKETGEEPVLLKDKKTNKSVEQLAQLYKNKGYFRATASDEVNYAYKKAKVRYNINTGPAYFIDTIEYSLPAGLVTELYNSEKDKSFLKVGDQFNQSNFFSEQSRITNHFKNSGIYNFRKNFISFTADTNKAGHKVKIKLIISDLPVKTSMGLSFVPHKIYTVSTVNVYTDYKYENYTKVVKDSISGNGYYFLAKDENLYKPRALKDAIFFEPGKVYDEENKRLTIKSLGSLGIFKLTDVKFKIDSTNSSYSSLISNIYLTPLKRNTTKIEFEGTNSNTLGLGLATNFSFTNRNTFGGAEIFSVSVNGMVGNQKETSLNNDAIFNAYQYGVNASLQFPRFLLPFETRNFVPKKMMPKTTINASLNNQLNIGLSKNSSNASIDYSWRQSPTKSHSIGLYNLQFIKYLNSQEDYFRANPSEYENIKLAEDAFLTENPEYEDLRDTKELYVIMLNDDEFKDDPTYQDFANSVQRYQRLTQNYLISSSSYSFTYNSQGENKEKSFLFFRGRVELAGTMFSLANAISPLNVIEDANGFESKTVFGMPYAQFVKFDLDFRKYWRLNSKDKLAFRALVGLALPFGNSNTVPFERAYFSGGVSDIRAWRPYELGPGGVQDYPFDYSYDKVKITLGLEYRFGIFNKLLGAVFVDAGNIWGIGNTDELSNFKVDTFYKQLGVGSGFGLRYDFNFFVFRFDFGYKTYDPSKPEGKRWVLEYQKLFDPQVNFAIGYPF